MKLILLRLSNVCILLLCLIATFFGMIGYPVAYILFGKEFILLSLLTDVLMDLQRKIDEITGEVRKKLIEEIKREPVYREYMKNAEKYLHSRLLEIDLKNNK